MRSIGLSVLALASVASGQMVREGVSYGPTPAPYRLWLPRLTYGAKALLAQTYVLSRDDQKVRATLGREPVLSGRRIYSRPDSRCLIYDATTFKQIGSFTPTTYDSPFAASVGGQRVAFSTLAQYGLGMLGPIHIYDLRGRVGATYASTLPTTRIVGGYRIFVTAGPEVRDLSGRLIWRDNVGGQFDLSPDQKAVVSLSGGWLVASDAATGSRLWQRATTAAGSSSVRIDGTSSVAYVIEPRPDGLGKQLVGYRLSDGSPLPHAAPIYGERILDASRGTREILIESDLNELGIARVTADGALVSDEPFGTAKSPGDQFPMQGDLPRVVNDDAPSRKLTILDGITGRALRSCVLASNQYSVHDAVKVDEITPDGNAALAELTRNGKRYLQLIDHATGQHVSSLLLAAGTKIQVSDGYVWATVDNGLHVLKGWRIAPDGLSLRQVLNKAVDPCVLIRGRYFAYYGSFEGDDSVPVPVIFDVITGKTLFSKYAKIIQTADGAFIARGRSNRSDEDSQDDIYAVDDDGSVRLVAEDLHSDVPLSGLSRDGTRIYNGVAGYYDTVQRVFVPSGEENPLAIAPYRDPRYWYLAPYLDLEVRTFFYTQ